MLRQSSQHGFTLLEVCLAMLMASLFLTAMLAQQPRWLKLSNEANNRISDFYSEFNASTPNITKACSPMKLASGETLIECKLEGPKSNKAIEYSILTE